MPGIGCVVALAGCAVVAVQWAGILPPLGVSWGDGNRPGGAGYSLGLLDGSLIFETLHDVKPWAAGTGGSAIKFDGQSTGFAGFNYRRYDIRLASPDGKRLPGTYGTQTRFWIAPGWILLFWLAAAGLCRKLWVNQRRREREANQRCLNCGYDLRATPDRCPECGLVRARPPAA
ncbi:MAG TPA: hypothetical protein VH475_16330 [Tepidisphaeraceae bacterium]|jgi:hypothetical protein